MSHFHVSLVSSLFFSLSFLCQCHFISSQIYPCAIGRVCPQDRPCFAGQQGEYQVSVDLTQDIRTNITGDIMYQDQTNLLDYYVNVCAPSSTQCEGSTFTGIGVVKDSRSIPPTCAVLGAQAMILDWIDPNNVDAGVTITYSQGTRCGITMARSVTFNYICAPLKSPTIITSAIIGPSTECIYNITISSPHACVIRTMIHGPIYPDNDDDISGGTIFCIIVLVGIVVYLGVSISYLYFVKHARGSDLIPHRAFWSELPSLVRDGCRFSWSLISGGGSRDPNAGTQYETIDDDHVKHAGHIIPQIQPTVDTQRGRTSSKQGILTTSYQNDGINNVAIAGIEDTFGEPSLTSRSFETMRSPPSSARSNPSSTTQSKTPRQLQVRPRQSSATSSEPQPYE